MQFRLDRDEQGQFTAEKVWMNISAMDTERRLHKTLFSLSNAISKLARAAANVY